jgi:His/Glu/Gln/Arg/opine family amino acid ABC transporter permease subunit
MFNKRSLITLGILAFFGVAVYYFFVTKGITYIWHWEKIPEMLFYHGAKSADDPTIRLRMGVLMMGFMLTLKISVASIFFAIIIGTIVGIARLSNEPMTRGLSLAYVELIRNTPLLVQIYIIYFFVGTMLRLSAFTAGTAALSIFAGAYVGEIVLADLTFQAIQGVARTYHAFEIYFTVAFLYLVMTFTLSMATQYIERRLAISD